MPKTYTAQKRITLGPVGQTIANLSPQEKAIYKAQAFVNSGKIVSFTQDPYVVTISNVQFINGLVQFDLQATKNGQPLHINNPIQIKNPPILVPDGTFYQETLPDGQVVDMNNYKEDLIEAGKQIILNLLG